MKKIFVLFLGLLLFLSAVTTKVDASTRVKGYYRSNGTYVNSYYRSDRDTYKSNNYSSYGNYNPYTGKKGYVKW